MKAFSFLECAVVMLVLATVAVVAIPLWTSDRILENEEKAIGLLRAIVAAQPTFLDRSEGKSYGLLEELTGTRSVRELPETPPLLEDIRTRRGLLRQHGYLFVVFLPSEDGQGAFRPMDVDSRRASKGWVGYAWPLYYGVSGRRVFGVSTDGILYALENSVDSFAGTDDIPPAPLLANRMKSNPFTTPPAWVTELPWEPVP